MIPEQIRPRIRATEVWHPDHVSVNVVAEPVTAAGNGARGCAAEPVTEPTGIELTRLVIRKDARPTCGRQSKTVMLHFLHVTRSVIHIALQVSSHRFAVARLKQVAGARLPQADARRVVIRMRRWRRTRLTKVLPARRFDQPVQRIVV
jgi:hypothetical protein